jgi:hypothetical protein
LLPGQAAGETGTQSDAVSCTSSIWWSERFLKCILKILGLGLKSILGDEKASRMSRKCGLNEFCAEEKTKRRLRKQIGA